MKLQIWLRCKFLVRFGGKKGTITSKMGVMKEPFISVYRKEYLWTQGDLRKKKKQVEYEQFIDPDNEMWYVEQKLSSKKECEEKLAAAEALIKKMQRKRLWSTYQVSYCKEIVNKGAQKSNLNVQSFENELLEYCKNLFEPKTQKILPPLVYNRRLIGYIRPRRNYTPLTTYQIAYGYGGYLTLKQHHH